METKLKKYKQKRDFEKTNEPIGNNPKKTTGQLHFVVQHHWARREHYDFRLEHQGVLLSWAVPKGPSFNPDDRRLAIKVENHPLEYRNFEGTIPKGEYGGGTVMLWDEGYYLCEGSIGVGIKKGMLKFALLGERLKGVWSLVKINNKEDKNWLLIKERDAFAKDNEQISKYKKSVRTGRTKQQIEKG